MNQKILQTYCISKAYFSHNLHLEISEKTKSKNKLEKQTESTNLR